MSKAFSRTENDIDEVDPDSGDTSLHCAVSSGSCETLEILLKTDFSPDSLNHYHRTPLHLAASRRKSNLIQTLIDHHTSLDLKDQWDLTPLASTQAKKY